MSTLPELKITVFSDYICPFCYVGNHRLKRLRDHYNLLINWRLLEIHPETAAMGEPVTDLEYPPETWQQMMNNLEQITADDDLPITMPDFIANSKLALLLSEASKLAGRDIFYCLHDALFHNYFVNNENIGDKDILIRIAADCKLDKQIIETAWSDKSFSKRLQDNYRIARQHSVESVPSYVIGSEILTGAVSEQALLHAASNAHSQ